MKIENDNMEGKAFGEFLTKAFRAAEQTLKAGGSFYVWFASCEHINFETALNNVGLKVRQNLVWNKNHFILGRQDYQWKHEPCLYGWKEGAAHYFTDSRSEASVISDEQEINIDQMKKQELADLLKKIFTERKATTVMDFAKPAINTDHPTMKPIPLFGYLMHNSSRQGENVLDTFGGSGTTLICAEQMGRRCFTMELDPHYCDVIIARWEKFTGRKAERINA